MASQRSEVVDVSTAELQAWFREGRDVRLLDVRTPGEFETAHIDGSVNIPVDELDHVIAELRQVGAELVVVCHSGARAASACDRLRAGGVGRLRRLHGGVAAWEQAGGPLNRGRRRWSLERQVRLVAGSIVASSILISVRHPGARFVAGAIGAGLTFAAVSDTCALGSVLAKLPHNRPARPAPLAETARTLHTPTVGTAS